MGQKVNPVGIRLGITRDWTSRWFANTRSYPAYILQDWQVRESWFAGARPDCHFMHCLPVRRNVAVADEVLDGPRSQVIREAANRMVVQMAVLYRLLKG